MKTVAFNNTLDRMDLIDILKAFYPKTPVSTFFSSAHGTSSKVDHLLGNTTSLNKFRKIAIISSVFSNHHSMKLDINYYQKKTEKHTKTWKLNNMSLNNKWVNKEIKEGIKRYIETN